MTNQLPDPSDSVERPASDYQIRPARPGDAALLPDIERRAASLFIEVGLAFLAEGEPTPEAVFAEACEDRRLWIAEQTAGTEGDTVVGFALAKRLEGSFHLQGMDVVPEHGRRGLGRRLVEAVVDAGRERGHDRITLTTFRDIPWNAPFYARLDFEELALDDFTPEIRALVAKELEAGLLPDLRCVMARPLRAQI